MTIVINGDTGLTGVTNISSAATNTPVVMTDSASTSNTCRAWVNFNGVSSSVAIRASFNVSSITYVATGNYVVNYTTPFSDTNYAVTAIGRRNSSDSNYCMQLRGSSVSGGTLYSTTQTAITGSVASGATLGDADIACFVAFR